jgi:hypothetical protein
VSAQSARLEPDRTTLERCAWTDGQDSVSIAEQEIQVGVSHTGCTATVEEADDRHDEVETRWCASCGRQVPPGGSAAAGP